MSKSKYNEAFRSSTVQLILNNNKSVKDISIDLDIHEKTLYSWIRAYKLKNNLSVESRATYGTTSSISETIEEELKRLRSENKILKQEREILKKAAAYFAKETL
ncbi:transposase [Aliarcobacter butzleri]|uniref:transposase n=1 Tax=Aliarcobacter butzleri TaxID=28197 RepID=UPI0024DEB810|nr:transposase [Aliarcobacter butzleri]MDK2082869.1 transposase [Aliarcobacter butzleri]